jgi:NAD+ synthase
MKINAPFVEKILTMFIKETFSKFQYKTGILGISGGLDSSVCAFLAAKALGADNVIGFIFPYGELSRSCEKDAGDIVNALNIRSKRIDILPMVNAYYKDNPSSDRRIKGNKMARERMSILYDQSEREHALILGTSNKTELLLGYGTIHGDMACAINPIGDLYKTQLRLLAAHLGVPEHIRNKVPTAGLWEGQTDEEELGLTYDEIDKILLLLVDKRKPRDKVVGSGFAEETVDKIIGLIKKSEFKRHLPPIAKISERTVGHDFLFPYDRDR